jgi:alpha-aminoadipate carrier protein LysW
MEPPIAKVLRICPQCCNSLNAEKEIELKGKCPECDADIDVPEDAVDGEILTCDECGSDIEVVKSDEKLQLRKAELKGEDWGE